MTVPNEGIICFETFDFDRMTKRLTIAKPSGDVRLPFSILSLGDAVATARRQT